MNLPLGSSRTVVKERYALFTTDGFVPSHVPGWSGCTPYILISPRLGAEFVQMHVTLEEGGRGSGMEAGLETFVYVLEGTSSLTAGRNKRAIATGQFAYLPPGAPFELVSERAGSRLLIFQKPFESQAGQETPALLIGDSAETEGKPFLGNPRARLQTLLPDTPAFDLAVNIFTYDPGAALPFVETHIMEHGLLMLDGAGVYRLDADWHPVQAGDVIWMAPYCPQWFVAMGDVPARYIYYKNVSRPPPCGMK